MLVWQMFASQKAPLPKELGLERRQTLVLSPSFVLWPQSIIPTHILPPPGKYKHMQRVPDLECHQHQRVSTSPQPPWHQSELQENDKGSEKVKSKCLFKKASGRREFIGALHKSFGNQ